MKKGVIVLFLSVALLISSSALAQEQAQTYSGFDKFIDNVRMLFSFGDKKVMLALDIREKELNSAIVNTQNGDDEAAEENLDGARKRLQFVQNKVSEDIAEDVKTNTHKIINRVNAEEDLPDNFQMYILEEEKTQLTADLVMEVEGKEGQTITRELIRDSESGESKVEITVEGDGMGTEVAKIEDGIREIDVQIADVIKEGSNVVEGGENQIDTPSKTKDNEDVTPKPNVFDDEVAPGPEGIVGPGDGVVDDD